MSMRKLASWCIVGYDFSFQQTSTTIAACAYALATNPEVQEKLREEVMSVVGQDELVTPQHIQDMQYLRNTIKETTRSVCHTEYLLFQVLRIVLTAQIVSYCSQ